MIAAITEASQEALDILRDGSTFSWTTVTLLAFVFYVYAVEIERRRWDIILAGIAFFLMDVFNELVNSAILQISDRSALWTVTGDSSYLILVGWCIEIVFLFLVTGIIFVKQLPPDPRTRILGVPNRVFLVLAFSILCVLVEVFLESTGYFHWDYWWWNVPFVPLIVIFGYATFFAIAAYVYDLGTNHRKQLRIVGGMAAINATLAVGFGLAGWL